MWREKGAARMATFRYVLTLVICICGSVAAVAAAGSATDATIAGHRQPLGNHRPAEVKIDEFSEPITGDVFFNDYIKLQKPVVFRGFAKKWPAFSRWTDATLAEEYGSLQVKIEPKKDGSSFGAEGILGIGRDTIENFVSSYKARNKYIVSELPTPMYKDVLIHESMGCGELSRSLVEVDLWVSSGGTRSRLHRDAFNAVNCLLSGTKAWYMIDNNQTDNVYFVASGKYEMGGLSPINVDSVNLKRFSRFRDVKYGYVDIEAGDCLFIPGGHYHQVKSTGDRNIAVSVLFGRVDKFSKQQCEGKPLVARPLTEFDVLWRWAGTGIMDMGRGDDYFFKQMFRDNMPSKGKQELSMTGLVTLLVNDMGMERTTFTKQMAKEMMKLLDVDGDNKLSMTDLENADRQLYRNLSFLIEGESDLQNGYEFELGLLDYHLLRDTLEELLMAGESEEGVSKEDFTTAYTAEPLKGSVYRAGKLFSALDSNGDGKIHSSEVSAEILERHLEPYEIGYDEGGERRDTDRMDERGDDADRAEENEGEENGEGEGEENSEGEGEGDEQMDGEEELSEEPEEEEEEGDDQEGRRDEL